MKVKSLLFAALVAGFSMSANAEDYLNVGDKMTAENVASLNHGEMVDGGIAVTLTKNADFSPAAADFTNIQFSLVFPVDAAGKGLRPCKDEDDVYDWAGDDIVMAGKPKAPVVSYSNNFDVDANFPTYTVVGANMTKNAQKSQPCQLYCFNVKADEGMATGDYQIKVKNLKFTTYSDDSYATAAEQVLCTVHVEGVSAINDLNANATVKTRKVVENGQVYIIAGDVKYNVMGQKVK